MILRNIFQRKGRTIMTILAVAVSSALLISMLSIGEGIKKTAYLSIEESKEDIIIATTSDYLGFIYGGISNGHNLSDELSKDTENITAVSPILLAPIFVNIKDKVDMNGTAILVAGTVPEKDNKFMIKEGNRYRRSIYGIGITFYEDNILEGEDYYFNNGNYNGNFTSDIVIDKNIALKYNLTKNSTLYLSATISTEKNSTENTTFYEFKVKGIFDTDISVGGTLAQQFKGFANIRLSELQTLLGSRYTKENDSVSQILLSLHEYKRNDVKFVKDFAEKLKEEYPKYQILTKADRLSQLERDIGLTSSFSIAIGMVSLIIGLLFVIAIMIMVVAERTNEIGMLRAIGISKETIFSQIFLESMFIVIIGAFIGLIPGYYGSIALSNYFATGYGITREFYAFTPMTALYTLILLIGTGSFISLYPAYRAMKMDIIKALKRVK